MPTAEIEKRNWLAFFDGFSRQHEGWLVTLEVFDQAIGAQPEARDLTFEGISVSAGNDAPESIAINLGKEPEDHVTHAIANPARVWLQQSSAGANEALEIEAADGARTLLRISSPMLPEMVDGVVLEK